MTPILRGAATRAILMFHYLWGQKNKQESVHRPQLLKRKESRSGFKLRSLFLPAYRLTARPNRLTLSCLNVRSLLIPGHLFVLQASVSSALPSHESPPCCGAGLSHSRCRCRSPPPQDVLHGVHWAQRPHSPSTEHNRTMALRLVVLS